MAKEGPNKILSKAHSTEQVNEMLLKIENATYGKELSAKEKGLTTEEHEKKHGKREILTSSEGGAKNVTLNLKNESSYGRKSWVYDKIPIELRRNAKIILEFQEKIALQNEFQRIWNYRIFIPKGLTESMLMTHSSQQITDLQKLSGFDLSVDEIKFSKEISEEVSEIQRVVRILKEKMKKNVPTREVFDRSEDVFVMDAVTYLKYGITIRKLEEILDILVERIKFY